METWTNQRRLRIWQQNSENREETQDFHRKDFKGEETQNFHRNEIKEKEGFNKNNSKLNENSFLKTEKEYYQLDEMLNKVMTATKELEEAQLRLEKTEEELALAQNKLVFLLETGWTNRLLADAFSQTAKESYVRLLAKKKAVEETLRHAEKNHRNLNRQFEDLKRIYLKKK